MRPDFAAPRDRLLPPSARQLAATAGAIFREGPLLLRLFQRFRVFTCPFEELVMEVPPGSCVLDVGCGGGLFLGLLHETGRLQAGVGLDVSPTAIALARRMAALVATHGLRPGALTSHLGSAEDDWPARVFDVVAVIDLLHHLRPGVGRSVFDRAAARLRPGGRLLYKDMGQRPRWRSTMNRLHDLVMARQWIHEVDAKDVEAWAAAAGLRILRSARINRAWYAHDLRVFER